MALAQESELADKLPLTDEKFELFYPVHKKIISLNQNIEYRIFPLYVKYVIEDKVLFLIYFKGKFASTGILDLGMNLHDDTTVKGLVPAEYMKDKSINWSTKVTPETDVDSLFEKIIKCLNY
jgi:predicted transport protein